MQNNLTVYALTIDDTTAGQRLDKALSAAFAELSRTRLQNLIDSGHVTITPARKISASLKLMIGDQIQVSVPDAIDANPIPQEIPLDVVYEDSDLLVINKPAGMVVHPAPGHPQETLVNALLSHCADSLSGIGGVKRPGIVHRLDKDTSGLMVVAKNDQAHQALSVQFSGRSLSRTYTAFVWGVPELHSGSVKTLIGRHPRSRQKMAVLNRNGKEAITHYKVLKVVGEGIDPRLRISMITCKLATGRTHQIRVHMFHLGHPLIGDPLYGRTPKGAIKIWKDSIINFPRQALHAQELSFIHPRSGDRMDFICDLPADLSALFAEIGQ